MAALMQLQVAALCGSQPELTLRAIGTSVRESAGIRACRALKANASVIRPTLAVSRALIWARRSCKRVNGNAFTVQA